MVAPTKRPVRVNGCKELNEAFRKGNVRSSIDLWKWCMIRYWFSQNKGGSRMVVVPKESCDMLVQYWKILKDRSNSFWGRIIQNTDVKKFRYCLQTRRHHRPSKTLLYSLHMESCWSVTGVMKSHSWNASIDQYASYVFGGRFVVSSEEMIFDSGYIIYIWYVSNSLAWSFGQSILYQYHPNWLMEASKRNLRLISWSLFIMDHWWILVYSVFVYTLPETTSFAPEK